MSREKKSLRSFGAKILVENAWQDIHSIDLRTRVATRGAACLVGGIALTIVPPIDRSIHSADCP